jgi:hypothetical protein
VASRAALTGHFAPHLSPDDDPLSNVLTVLADDPEALLPGVEAMLSDPDTAAEAIAVLAAAVETLTSAAATVLTAPNPATDTATPGTPTVVADLDGATRALAAAQADLVALFTACLPRSLASAA